MHSRVMRRRTIVVFNLSNTFESVALGATRTAPVLMSSVKTSWPSTVAVPVSVSKTNAGPSHEAHAAEKREGGSVPSLGSMTLSGVAASPRAAERWLTV